MDQEQRNLLVAMAAGVVILALWYLVFHPLIFPRPLPAGPAPNSKETVQKEQGDAKSPGNGEPSAPPPASGNQQPEVPAETFELKNAGRFRAEFDNRGASLRRLWIRYKSAGGEETEEVQILQGYERRANSLASVGLEAPWNIVDRGPDHVTFRTRQGSLEYTKTFRFAKDGRYLFEIETKIRNLSEHPARVEPRVVAFNGIAQESPYRWKTYFRGLVGKKPDGRGSLEFDQIDYDDPEDGPLVISQGPLRAVGVRNRHFTFVALPRAREDLDAFVFESLGPDELDEAHGVVNLKGYLRFRPYDLAGKADRTWLVECYAGPIREEDLEQASEDLSGILDYSGFDFVGKALLALLKFFFSIFGNFGVAILFTTLVIRILIFPLSLKSQISMHKMRKLQPKIQWLKERYKHDQQKLAQEQWKMFREHKVNPMSGCLPMLIQLPIFLGMYSVVDLSIELRNSPFLWFDSLTEPDRLIDFGRQVHILFFRVDALNLLPIVMTIAWVAQSLTAPRSEDPQLRMQQKMFLFMPIVFGLICYGLASGLSWYFLVNSSLSFIEQQIIKKRFEKQQASEFPAPS